ncbi:MAG: TonB-dependent receptor plug domain-containing protein [Mangrovibacterium sp.]
MSGVFYDGIELGNAQNGVVDLGRFSLENMESVSLYNGQKSSIFQPAKDFASAGSIYMATRTPSFDSGKNYNIKANIKAGSFGTINPAVLWEQQLGQSVSLSFNAEYMYTTGKYKFSYKKKNGYDTTEVRQNGDVYALRIEQGLYGKIKDGEWKVKAYFYNSERGYPGAAVREEPGKFKHQDRQWDSNFFLQSSLRKSFGRRYGMLLNSKYAYDYLHYLSDPRQDVTTMYVDNRYKQQEVYFSSTHRFTFFEWWSANLSADFQWNTLDADLTDFVYPRRYTGLVAAAGALYFPRFKLQASVLGTFVHETTKIAGAMAGDKQKYTPAVVVSWQPWKVTDLNLRAFYKKIFRMPTLNDLYYTFIGNKNLNPEYTVQYNVGATWAKTFDSWWAKRMEIQVDAYYNEVTDKIIAMPTSNQFQWTMINLGFVEIRGIDAAVQTGFQFGRSALNTRLTYTWAEGTGCYQSRRTMVWRPNSVHPLA